MPHVASYTYGSPRVGDGQFIKQYNDLVPDTWRFVNERDAVPCARRSSEHLR